MWFTETPWPPILICSVVGAALFSAWYATGRAVHLFGVGGALLAAGIAFFVERLIVTDAEQVEANVHSLTSAFQQRDLDETLEFISANEQMLRALVTVAINVVEVHDLRITDVDVTMKAENSLAICHFRANATVSVAGHGDVGHQPSRWELTWRREADRWRVIKVRRLDTITGEEMRIPLPMAATH